MDNVELPKVARSLCGSKKGKTTFVDILIIFFYNFPFRNDRLAIKNELQIREKALKDKKFPSTQVIHEFKKKLEPPRSFNKAWKQPNIVKIVVSNKSQ